MLKFATTVIPAATRYAATVYNASKPVKSISNTSSNSPAQTGHTYWQEEAYQKIKVMKQLYFPKLSGMYWKSIIKRQKEGSNVQQLTPDQHANLSMLKNILERVIPVLHFSKADISVGFMQTLVSLEQHLLTLLDTINQISCSSIHLYVLHAHIYAICAHRRPYKFRGHALSGFGGFLFLALFFHQTKHLVRSASILRTKSDLEHVIGLFVASMS